MKSSLLKVLPLAVVLTIINYGVSYLLSSKEAIFDGKYIALIFIFSVFWSFFIVHSDKYKKNVALLCFFFSVLGFIVPVLGALSEPMFMPRLSKDFLTWYTIPLGFLTLRETLKCGKIIAIIGAICIGILLSYMAFLVGYFKIYGVQLSVDSLLAVMQTNTQEGIEFFNTYISWHMAISGVILYATVVFLLYKLLKAALVEQKIDFKNTKVIVAVGVVFFVSAGVFFDKSYFVRTVKSTIARNDAINKFQIYREARLKKLLATNPDASGAADFNFAIIVGETHTRSHMSLTGYSRKTTPWLDDMVARERAIFMNNGFSCAAQTIPALEMTLTERNQYNDISMEDALTITEIAQAYGFNVVWISNQVDDNIAGRVGHEADQQYWLNKRTNDTWLRQKNGAIDGVVVKALEQMQKPEKKTLYVINLIGSHATYDCRYPEDFIKWDDKGNETNAYDNSVLYNDYVMSKITDLLVRNRLCQIFCVNWNKFLVQCSPLTA